MKQLLALAALLSIGVAAPAHAATLHAAPQPKGNGQCSPAGNACTIQQAFANAGDNDEIVLAPGTYGSPVPYTSGLSMTKANVRIHGTHGFPRPRIEFNDNLDTPMSITGAGDRLEYVDIHDRGAMGLQLAGNSTASQVFVRADGSASTAYACQITSGTLVNSVCWKAADSGAAAATIADCAGSATAVYRNATLVGNGSDTTGLTVRAFCGSTGDARATNVIARAGEFGFHTGGGGPGATATLHADHSNYSSQFDTGASNGAFFDDRGGNQTGKPVLFVNAGQGNFRERPKSPTIDKGTGGAANGPRDLADAPRARGTSTDIGAFEFQPPPACTLKPKSNTASEQGKLRVVARCNQAATVTVRGTVKRKRKNRSPKTYTLQPVTVPVAANAPKVVALQMPQEALSKLRDGANESATFTLRATNANGTGTAHTSIEKIVLG